MTLNSQKIKTGALAETKAPFAKVDIKSI
jgi:hypothetical protein